MLIANTGVVTWLELYLYLTRASMVKRCKSATSPVRHRDDVNTERCYEVDGKKDASGTSIELSSR